MRTLRIVAQAVPVILISLVGEMLAGTVFGGMATVLEETPGLLVMVPALLLLRGNINASLGSRLSSAVHLGLIPSNVPANDAEVQVNIRASLVLGAVMGLIAGLMAHGASIAFSGESAGVPRLTAIGIIVGFTSGLPMVPITTRAVRAAFRRGIDPDNVVGPLILTIGDIVTVIILFVVAGATLLIGGSAS